MRAFNQRIAIVTASLALSALPTLAFAQRAPGSGGGAGSAGAATAVPRGSSSAPSSGGSNSGATSTSTSTNSGSTSSSPTPVYSPPSPSVSAAPMRMAAPERRMAPSYMESGAQRRAAPPSAPRVSAPSSAAGAATPRAASSPNARAGTVGVATARTNPRTAAASNNASGTAEVPSWSRNRGNHAQTGTAIARSPDNPAPGTAAYYTYYANRYGYYNPYYYDPYGFYGYYGIGGGYYGFYNPYYAPYGLAGFGLDPGFGVPYYSDPSDPYMYGTGYGDYSSRVYSGEGEGALKLKVKPREAKVYVDGYYVGNVDQFDGMFQKLSLNGGNHHVEIKADGYETSEFDVLITPKQTLTFSGDLKKLQ